MEYDVTIVECITIEKLKYYYTKKQLVKKINSNLKELCKKWNIKAELLSDADRYKKGECYYATIDWKRQTDEDLKLIAFNTESMVLALTEKEKIWEWSKIFLMKYYGIKITLVNLGKFWVRLMN